MTGYRVGDDVAWVEQPAEELTVVVALLPDGPPVSLVGSSAAIWLGAVEGGDAATVRDRAAAMTGAAPADIEQDVTGFLDQLVERRLLQTD